MAPVQGLSCAPPEGEGASQDALKLLWCLKQAEALDPGQVVAGCTARWGSTGPAQTGQPPTARAAELLNVSYMSGIVLKAEATFGEQIR